MVTLLEIVALGMEEKAWLFVNYVLKEQLSNYAELLYKDIPIDVFEGLLSVLCIGVLAFIFFDKRCWRIMIGLILVEYIFLIYCSTVIFRIYSEERGFNLSPFWSYEAIHNGNEVLILQNIMNVMAFIPIGILFCLWFTKGKWWKVMGLGCLISISIEVLQFILKRGFSELDDVMHNTLGCIIGYGIVQLVIMVYSAVVKKKKRVNY